MKRLLTFSLCLLAGITLTMAQVTLTFNPDKGVKYRYCMNMEQDIAQAAMGQEFAMKNSMVTTYDMTVLEKNADGIKLSFQFADIYFEMSGSMANMKYDSKNPAPADDAGLNDILAKMFGGLLSKQFEATVMPDGSVKSVTGMDAVADAVIKGIESYGDMAVQMGEGLIRQQFNNDAMRQSFEQSFKIYPGKPIKVGDSYEVAQSVSVPGIKMNIQSVYQLASADQTVANMAVKSTIDGMEGKLKGEQGGTIQFDLKTGLTKEAVINQKIAGILSNQGMEVDLKANSKVKTTITVE